MKVNEDNVVELIKQKNEKAIRFMIDEYGGLIYSIIKRQNIQHHEIEECMDDVLLSVWNNIHSYDSKKNSFNQWVAAIANYKAIDTRRKLNLLNRQVLTEEIKDVALPNQMEQESIFNILEQLPERERKLFERYYIEGVPTSELAAELNVKESWIHNKLSRGRKKLKRIIQEGM